MVKLEARDLAWAGNLPGDNRVAINTPKRSVKLPAQIGSASCRIAKLRFDISGIAHFFKQRYEGSRFGHDGLLDGKGRQEWPDEAP